jgi:hypothetical protein
MNELLLLLLSAKALTQQLFGHSVAPTAALVVVSLNPAPIYITICLHYRPSKSLNSYDKLISILYPLCSFIRFNFKNFVAVCA